MIIADLPQRDTHGAPLEDGILYRVTFAHDNPRYDGAIWRFTYRGRGGTAHGNIVFHHNFSVLAKYRGEDIYLSASHSGPITPVSMDTCVGWDANPCSSGALSYDANNNRVRTPDQVIRDLPVTGDPRCSTCQVKQTQADNQRAAEAKAAGIDDILERAMEARKTGVAPQAPQVPVAAPVERHVVQVTAADGAHPLAHKVPGPESVAGYISRDIDGVSDLEWLDYAASRQEAILLEGPTESGKTRLVKAWCARSGRPLVLVSCNGAFDPTNLWGSKTILSDGSIAFDWADTLLAIKHGGVLYLNEINFCPGKSLAVVHSVTDDGHRMVSIPELGYSTVDVHDEFVIMADCNPGYEGTRDLNEATKRRFTTKVWDYDEGVEQSLIQQLPVLHTIKEEVRNIILSGDVTTPMGPAKLQRFERHAIDLNVRFATTLFLDSFKATERDAVGKILKHHEDVLASQVEQAKARQVAA